MIKNEYTCALNLIQDLIGGKWKQRILWHIYNGDNRFSLLQRAIPDISHKMLVTQLKELETSGLLNRYDYDVYPKRVIYEINKTYVELIPLLNSLCDFASHYAITHNIKMK